MTCLCWQFLAEGKNEMTEYVDVYKVVSSRLKERPI